MKTREDVLALFRVKYDHLKEVYPEVGPFDESQFDENQFYETPDGGWQLNLSPSAAITLRPGSGEAHETHGGICARWYKEGGAYNELKERGWLGYPVSDEEDYDGNGDSNGRISHFENGDIVWKASTPDETQVVPKDINETTALNPRRREIIKPLEGLRALVKRPSNGLTDSRARDMEQGIDAMERSIRYDRYRVTVFGAFSSGKSTLLNALMGADYLPSADLPTTNITTEIFRSDRFYVFMPSGDLAGSQKELQAEAAKEISGGTFLAELERDGLTIPGVGVSFPSGDSSGFRQVVAQLASEQNRLEKGLSKFKKCLKDTPSPILQLGIPNLPEWLDEITLTDAPGAGSVYKGHESIIDDIIPKTQLVLYVVESPKAGSFVDGDLCQRIVNSYRRKVFFILNKIDQQNDDEIADALAELKEHIPFVKAGDNGEAPPPKPEFLKSSALCESIANQLSDGSATIKDLTGNKKLSISELLVSDEWKRARSEKAQKRVAIRFLHEQSQFDQLRERIKSYLHEENKELPFCEKAEDLVKTYGQELDAVSKTAIAILQADKSEESLKEKQQKLHLLRERSAKEARSALKDFQEAALKPETGIMSKIESKLAEIPDEVATKLERVLGDKGEFKRLMSKKGAGLSEWLTREVADRMEPISRGLDGELRRQGDHLLARLRPILERVDEATLAYQGNGISKKSKETPANYLGVGENAEENILATTVSAGVTGGALAAVLGLTTGVVTSSVTIATAGTGLAGWLGTGMLAELAAMYGLGTLATSDVLISTAPFWGLGLGPILAIIAVSVATLAIPAFFVAKKIIRGKIVKKVKAALEKQIVGDETSSIRNKTKKKVAEVVTASVDGCRNNLDAYLDNLDKQEKKIIADVAKAQKDKGARIKTLDAFREEVLAFVASSVQTLRELNPGKEPVHG